MKRRSLLSGLLALPLMGFTDPELRAERQAQSGLPRSNDAIWPKLRACKVFFNNRNGLYSLLPTPEVKAMQGKILKIKGFMLPLDGLERSRHFLLGVNTPVCFYHPPGEPNEVIDVKSVKPVLWSEKPITIEGQFSLINNGEMGVFFALNQANLIAR